MKTSRKAAIFFAIGVALIISATVYIFQSQIKPPLTILPHCWQFYPNPTSLEPPGTVFRINKEGRRIVVDVIDVPMTTGAEALGSSRQTIKTSANILTSIIGKTIDTSASQEGSRLETLEFELKGVEREITTDVIVDKVLKAFRSTVEHRLDNHYFIIRESRSALEIHYLLSTELLNRLGGELSLTELANARADLAYESKGQFLLSQRLPERMRVMFLAEEIVMVSSSLAGEPPEFATIEVTKPIVWK